MIDLLKKEIARHSQVFGQDIDASELTATKLHHGEGRPDSKVLFLVSASGQSPLCLVKIVRNPEFNRFLEEEISAQSRADTRVFKTARVLFSGMLGRFFYFAEEIVNGEPVGRKDAKNCLSDVLGWQNSVRRTSSVETVKIFEILRNLGVEIEKKIYEDYTGQKLDLAEYIHGDLTFMNLLKNEKGNYYLIDWEDSARGGIWGTDLVHYIKRTFNTASETDLVKTLENYEEHIGKDKMLTGYISRLYKLEETLDVLRKKNKALYKKALDNFSQNAN